VRELLRHDADIKDPHIPLLAWWAIEDKTTTSAREVLTLLSNRDDWNAPLMRTHTLERLARRFASETNSAGRQTSAWLLNTAPEAEHRAAVLRGFDAAWQGTAIVPGDQLAQALERAWNPADPLVLRVGLRTGLRQAQQQALARLASRTAPEQERVALAETIGQCRLPSAIPILAGLLGDKPKLQIAAISALQNFPDDSVAATLIDAYPKLTADAKTRARSSLVSRPEWASQLLRAVETNRIDPKSMTPDQLQQIVRHNDSALTAAIEKRWGRMQPQTSTEKLSSINTLKLVLNPSGTTHRFVGDAKQGQVLFEQFCGTCHKLFGQGKDIGPELTGSDRKNTDWLLTHVVDPNAFIRPEYVNHNIEMKDGRSFTGLLADQNDSSVTVLDAQNQRTVLNRADIQDLAPSSISLMPEGLLEPLQHQQVRDLFKYLQGEEPK
jgi:putative heme-binding domain-containing protein